MNERTAQNRGEPGRQGLDRRRMLGGALVLSGIGGPVFARQATTPMAPPPDALALSANMLTRMAATVRMNGQRSRQFVLDTGAERTSIARDVAEALELPPGPSVMIHGVTSAQLTPTVRVARFLFGRRRYTDLMMPVFERSMLAADGLLGLDVLSKFRLSLDLAERVVTLAPSDQISYSRGIISVIPTRLSGGARARADESGQLILTNAVADGVPVQSFVDSGAQYSIGNTALLRAMGGQVAPRPIPLYGVTGQTIDAFAGRLETLQIARHQMGPTPLLFADLHAFRTLGLEGEPAILLGADILYRFRRVELDYGSRRMGFGGLRPRPTQGAAAG